MAPVRRVAVASDRLTYVVLFAIKGCACILKRCLNIMAAAGRRTFVLQDFLIIIFITASFTAVYEVLWFCCGIELVCRKAQGPIWGWGSWVFYVKLM